VANSYKKNKKKQVGPITTTTTITTLITTSITTTSITTTTTPITTTTTTTNKTLPLFSFKLSHLFDNSSSSISKLQDCLQRSSSSIVLPQWILLPFLYYPHTEYIEDLNFPWKPIRYLPSSTPLVIENDYSIYFEICNRIAFFYSLSTNSFLTESQQKKVLFCLDEYIPLCIYMDRTGFHRNNQISADILSHLMPSPRFVFSVASLPDLSMHTIFCNFWGNIGKKDDLYFQNNLDNIFTSLLSKSSPAACKRREYHAIVTKCWKEEKTSYIHDAISRIIAVSLLGAYDHAIYHPSFNVRREIYEWYMFRNSDKSVLENWIKKNRTLFTYIMRECFFYNISQIPFFDTFMERLYTFWNSLRKNAYDGVDEIRKFLNMNPIFNRHVATITDLVLVPIFHSLTKFHLELSLPKTSTWTTETILIDYNQKNLRISPKPMLSPFITYTKNQFEKYCNNNYRTELKLPNINTDDYRVELIVKYLRQLRPTIYDPPIYPSYDYLLLWGVSLTKIILPLHEAEELYMSEADRTKIRKLVFLLRRNYPQEFFLLRTHFDTIDYINKIILFDLPYHIKKKQVKTLNVLYGYPEKKELSPSAGIIQICETCGYAKGRILYDCDIRGKETKIPVYDTLTRNAYCRRIVDRNQVTKKTKVTKRKLTKGPSLVKIKHPYDCRLTKLTTVNLIGKLLWSASQGSIVLCPDCCHPMCHSPDIFAQNKSLTCGCRQFSKIRQNQLIAKQKKFYSDDADITMCVVCKRPRGKITQRVVVVDHVGIRRVGFCSKHPMDFIEKESRLWYLSEVKNKYVSRATKIMEGENGEKYHLKNLNSILPYILKPTWDNSEFGEKNDYDNDNEKDEEKEYYHQKKKKKFISKHNDDNNSDIEEEILEEGIVLQTQI